ncbi:hypothetical protein BKA69DRAFT_406388 [Paraphysoderma sedebokerense]|nr:hypothetical protein BKA69DRAFT_406388 [Paraphysoderma sedebokerense]
MPPKLTKKDASGMKPLTAFFRPVTGFSLITDFFAPRPASTPSPELSQNDAAITSVAHCNNVSGPSETLTEHPSATTSLILESPDNLEDSAGTGSGKSGVPNLAISPLQEPSRSGALSPDNSVLRPMNKLTDEADVELGMEAPTEHSSAISSPPLLSILDPEEEVTGNPTFAFDKSRDRSSEVDEVERYPLSPDHRHSQKSTIVDDQMTEEVPVTLTTTESFDENMQADDPMDISHDEESYNLKFIDDLKADTTLGVVKNSDCWDQRLQRHDAMEVAHDGVPQWHSDDLSTIEARHW